MLDALLFEFEGVLADTRAARWVALRRALRAEGIELAPAERAPLAALPVREVARAALAMRGERPDEVALDLIALAADRAFAAEAEGGLPLVEGAAELVRALHGRVRLGVVTRAGRREVGRVLALAELDHAFECIVAAEDVLEPKPSPEGYERALAKLGRRRGVRRAASLALEDCEAGIRAAHAAGLRCVAVGPLPADQALLAEGYAPTLAGQTLEGLAALGARRPGRRG